MCVDLQGDVPYGLSGHSITPRPMSAFGGKADMILTSLYVAFGQMMN
jgi:hypothetical protein